MPILANSINKEKLNKPAQSFHNDLISLKKILVGEWILYDYVKEFNKTKSAGMSLKKEQDFQLLIFDSIREDSTIIDISFIDAFHSSWGNIPIKIDHPKSKKFTFIFGEYEKYIRISDKEDSTLYVSYTPGKEEKYIKSTPVSKVINKNFTGNYEYKHNGKKNIATFDIEGKVKGFLEYKSYEIYLDELDCSRYNVFCFRDKKRSKNKLHL